MKKIALSEEGIENVYGARDANLKHIESLLNVQIRTQGGEITIEGDPKDELRAQQIFRQLKELIDEGYPLSNGDVKTAAQLLVENADLDLRDYFLRGGQKQVTRRRVTPKSVNQRRYLDSIDQFGRTNVQTLIPEPVLLRGYRKILQTIYEPGRYLEQRAIPCKTGTAPRMIIGKAPPVVWYRELKDPASQVEDAAQFSAWREWTRLARLVFEQADRSWQMSVPLLVVPASAAKVRSRRRRGGALLFLLALSGSWPDLLAR